MLYQHYVGIINIYGWLTSFTTYLPVLVLWLEGHQGAIFAAGQDVFRGGTINLLKLTTFLLPLSAICSKGNKKVKLSCYKG